MHRAAFVILALTTLSACSSASSDAENICAIANEMESQTFESDTERSTEMASRISDLDLTSDTRTAFEAIAHAEQSMRYELLQAAFAEQGVEGWECPALERLTGGVED